MFGWFKKKPAAAPVPERLVPMQTAPVPERLVPMDKAPVPERLVPMDAAPAPEPVPERLVPMEAAPAPITLHPSIDGGVKPGSDSFSGGVLVCHCATDPVKVKAKSQVAHNHACGCSKCWKPAGAKFSVVAVVGTPDIEVLENGDKLAVVDASATIQRMACTVCGVHLYGPVLKEGHPFTGLSFIHPELFEEAGAAPPTFAAFVSSIIEIGAAKPEEMEAVRARLTELGLEPYDVLNPPLMDYIATFTAKASGALPA